MCLLINDKIKYVYAFYWFTNQLIKNSVMQTDNRIRTFRLSSKILETLTNSKNYCSNAISYYYFGCYSDAISMLFRCYFYAILTLFQLLFLYYSCTIPVLFLYYSCTIPDAIPMLFPSRLEPLMSSKKKVLKS